MAKKVTNSKETRLSNLEGSSYLKTQQSQSARKTVFKISEVLNTGMSPEAVDVSMKIIEAGVNPYALCEIIRLMSVKPENESKDQQQGGDETESTYSEASGYSAQTPFESEE